MQVQCVMDIFNLRIHMYNTTGGVAVNKFCSFFVKEGYQFESFLEVL